MVQDLVLGLDTIIGQLCVYTQKHHIGLVCYIAIDPLYLESLCCNYLFTEGYQGLFWSSAALED